MAVAVAAAVVAVQGWQRLARQQEHRKPEEGEPPPQERQMAMPADTREDILEEVDTVGADKHRSPSATKRKKYC